MKKRIKPAINLQIGPVRPLIYILVFLAPIVALGSIIGMLYEYFYKYESGLEAGLVVMSVFFVLMTAFAIVFYKQFNLFRKCIKDGVVLSAHVKIIDSKVSGLHYGVQPPKRVAKILVVFDYNGKEIVKRSGRGGLSERYTGDQESGYWPQYLDYDDKQVNILYSEKYDEVFILKD